VESGPHTGRIVIDEVEVTEEAAILAARNKAEVRVVPTVGKRLIGDDKSPAGREVARNGKDVGSNPVWFLHSSLPPGVRRQQSGHQHRYNCFLFFCS